MNKLQHLGWKVINQEQGIPREPEKSLRSQFKEVMLPKFFKESKAINLTADGREWLTDKQLEEIFFEIQNFAGKGLHEANKEGSSSILVKSYFL